MTQRIEHLVKLLDIHSVESISDVLSTIKEVPDYNLEEKMALSRALSDVFYHAHHTGSTYMPKLAVRVAKQLGRFGPDILLFLLNETLESDSETAKFFGRSIARNKEVGLAFILKSISDNKGKEHELINLIQVLGYFKIPDVVDAIPTLLQHLDCNNYQVTSMALYTMGRIVQKHSFDEFNEAMKDHMFESVIKCLKHPKDLVRKNAARALGKMLRKGLLTNGNVKTLFNTFQAITGKDHNHNWDRAYIVRREVEDYLPYFKNLPNDDSRYDQSFDILSKRQLCLNTYHFIIKAPFVARKIEAGQFIIIRPHEFSERIPLSVCGWNRKEGTLHLIISAVGKTSNEVCQLEPGDSILDLVGPLGIRSHLPSIKGTSVVIGGGYGTGAIIPTAKDLKDLGNYVVGVIGARTDESLIMIKELEQVCDEVILTTNDGSRGLKGLVTDALRNIMDNRPINYVLAVGPVPMMKAVAEHTREQQIPTYVSLNAIMVDGTGMCGACRVIVDGVSKFACFHGPDFNGHLVDFDNLAKRQQMFQKEEKLALTV